MSTETINLTPSLYDYFHRLSLREPDVLKALREETSHLHGAVMQISPEQGQFMALLMKLMSAKKTLEVGTFTGYSALVVALALPADGQVVACDVSEESAKVAKRYWEKAGVADKITLHLAPALETLQKLVDQGEAGTFDFVFIDADKRNYANYYEYALTLLRSGGLVAIDNVLWSGKVADEAVQDEQTRAIREINEIVFKDKRVFLSMLPIGDGLTLAYKV